MTFLDSYMNQWRYECVDAFAVIADPTRRRILDTLHEGRADVGTLVARLGISQPRVSNHLGVLRDAGSVAIAVDARRYSPMPRRCRPARPGGASWGLAVVFQPFAAVHA
jgi:DNA-binding transcriptional ArsR family regulator